MKQRIVSLCLMLALCLGLLPVTAGAAAPKWQELYVGGVQISATGYWATDDAGNVTPAGDTQPADNYIHYDADTNILTLCNARIKKELSTDTAAGHLNGSAIGVLNRGDAALTIRLVGDNVIGDVGKGIFLLSISGDNAGLTITGGGSLDVRGSQCGIWVWSNTGVADLTIQGGARVAAAATTGGHGVTVESETGRNADLTVDGASLSAAGAGVNGAGIHFYGPDTPSLTVNNSAMVSASRIAVGAMMDTPVSIGGTGGLVFEGSDGTVYGTMKLPNNLTIGEGQSLTLAEGATLDLNGHNLIVDGGTVSEEIKNNLGEKLKITPSITTGENLPDGTVGVPYTANLEATGTEPITWSVTSGTLPGGLTLDASTGVISGTPTAAGNFGFKVTATNGWGTDDIKDFGITIAEAPDISVTGVTLDKTNMELTEGETATLTATVEPDNATNKNVTWSSDNADVATVDQTGKVTAEGAGTATITVTTEDGGKTATCTVTVRAANVPVTGVTLNKTNLTLQEKASETLTATVVPAEATNKNVTWTSSNANVATVDTDGTVTAKSAGTATITVTTEDGEKTAACEVTVTHGPLTKTEAKAPTCTEDGNTEYWTCEICKKIFSDAEGNTELTDTAIPATGHSYGDPAWTWAENKESCTATFTCTKCDHEETEQAAVTSQQTKAPTCTGEGVTTHTATVTFNGQTYTDTKTTAIPATGHSYGTPTWTWAEDGKSCTVTFTCKNDPNHTASPEVTVTSQVAQPAGCTTAGATDYTAKVTFGGTTYQSTTQLHDIPAAGHKLA